MKVSILTSGFPNGFTNDFIQCVKEYYDYNGSFALIASDFTGHSKTDKHLYAFLSMFRNNGILFNEVHVIDDRVTKEKSEEHMKDVYEASQYTTIYGIYDNTFIKIVNDTMEIYGEYFKYNNIAK